MTIKDQIVFEINKQRKFSSQYDYDAFSVVRLSPKIIGKLDGRKSWVKISNGRKSVYRIALGMSPTKGFIQKVMEIDYDSLLELGVSRSSVPVDEHGFYFCELQVQSTNFIKRVIAHWKHPAHEYRVPMQLV